MNRRTEPESVSEETAGREGAGEETAREDGASGDGEQRRFGVSRLRRLGTVSVAALFLLIEVLEPIADGSRAAWEIAQNSTLFGFLILAYVANSQRSVLVGEKEIRKSLPVWKDQSVQVSSVQTGDVRRVHVPVSQEGLWLYTDPEGDVALSIGAGLENPDELREVVLRRVSPSAEVTGLGREE